PSRESSLAVAETEYHGRRSAAIYVGVDVKDSEGSVADAAEVIIGRTAPGTLPPNVAITVHPELKYVQRNGDGTRYIIDEALVDVVAEQLGWDKEALCRKR
ncbi:isoleucine--tRNA ligase, partial [Staphylococcus pseudintermedius]